MCHMYKREFHVDLVSIVAADDMAPSVSYQVMNNQDTDHVRLMSVSYIKGNLDTIKHWYGMQMFICVS